MAEKQKEKRYDLEDRTFNYAKRVRNFIKKLSKDLINFDDSKQLLRSSGSVGANYIEANESLGKKDLIMRVRISRKEAKESSYWLKLFETEDKNLNQERIKLYNESIELMKIFGAILEKLK